MLPCMNNDQSRPDCDHLDMPAHDQTPDMSIREASAIADVTEKTIRRWIKNDRLHAVKLGGQYRITVADLERARGDDVQTPDMQRPNAGHDVSRVDMSERLDTGHDEGRQVSAPIDLAPLVEHIASLEHQVGQLTETSTMWQIRAMHLEEQLKQLTTTVPSTDKAAESPQSDDTDDQAQSHQHEETHTPAGMWARLWQWMTRE